MSQIAWPISLLLSAPLLLHAADKPEGPIQDLPPAPVYARPLVFDFQPGQLGDALAEVGAADWRDYGAGDLTDALQRVPGVTISRYNPVGSFGGNDGGAVFVRGHGSSRPGSDMAILTDGIPRFVGIWGHPLIDIFPLDFMESIRVYKSPQPVRVGNMGFAAIELFPASPDAEGPAAQADFGIGEFNTRSAAVLGRAGMGDFHVSTGFSHRRSDGHRPNAFGEVNAGTFGFTWTVADNHTLRFHSELSRSDATDPEPVGADPFPFPLTERYVTDNAFSYLKYAFQESETRIEARLFLESSTAEWTQFHQPPPPPFPAQTLLTITDFENWGLLLEAAGALSPSLRWEAGIDFLDYGGIVTENYSLAGPIGFPETRRPRTDLWGLLEHTLWQQNQRSLTLTAGLRKGWANDTGNTLSGQVGAVYRFHPNQTAFLNLSRSHNEVGAYAEFFASKWRTELDPAALDSEQLDHAEIGYQWQSEPLKGMVTLFHDEVTDSFRLAPPPVPGIFNQDGFSQYGVESHLQLTLTNRLSGSVALTWVDPDQPRPNNPEWSGSAALRWQPNQQWQVGLSGTYLDDRYTMGVRFDEPLQSVDSSFVTSAHFHYQPDFLRSVNARLSLHIDNLFDEEYAYRPGYPMPDRNWSLSLRMAY